MTRRKNKNKKRPQGIRREKRMRNALWGIVVVAAVAGGVAFTALDLMDYTSRPDAPIVGPNERKFGPAASDGNATLPVNFGRSWDEMDNSSKDGWNTELFSEKAHEQLKELGRLISRAERIDLLADTAPLVAQGFSCGLLKPEKLHRVFDDQTLRVERAEIDAESIQLQMPGPHRGAQGLAEALRSLSAPFVPASDVRFEFQIFRVNQSAESVTTRQYFALWGRTNTGMLEQNATWLIRWVLGGEDATPKLQWIGVEDFEQVTSSGQLFADCTESVLGNNASYRRQLLRGYNYWLERIQDTKQENLLVAHGLAVGDVNGDGLDDLYVCQEAGLPNRLFIQNPDGTAYDASDSSGVDWLESTRGALFVDLDNDSDQDLAIAIVGGVVLASNDGEGRFDIRDVLATGGGTMSLSAVDYDNDGDLDLYACVYDPMYNPNNLVGESLDGSDVIPLGNFVYHDANNAGNNSLFRNDTSEGRDWRFVDVTKEVGLDENNRRFSLAATWEDFDNDGDQDLYVANDYGRNNLYRNSVSNSGVAKFTDIAADANAEDSASGMSVTWGDFDRDGWMDLYVSNMFSAAGNRIAHQAGFKPGASSQVKARLQEFARGNTLLGNLGDDRFRDVSTAAAVTMGRWAWSSNFADLNNDGWEDLIVANGYITAEDTGDL